MRHIKNIFIFKFLVLTFILSCSFANGQIIKYVSYFPIPYGYHNKVNVANLSLLATKNGGEVVVGSPSYVGGGLSVDNYFNVQDLSVSATENSSNTVEMYMGSASGSTYEGTFSSSGDIATTNNITNLSEVDAQGTATVRSIYWDGKGGLGKNASAVTDWPTVCTLEWADLKLKGSTSYKTYLICADTATTDDTTTTPTTQTISYKPVSKQLAVARYCEAGHSAYFNNWGTTYSYNTLNAKVFSSYAYADSITVTSNPKYESCSSCAAGTLTNGAVEEMNDYRDAPWAGVAYGFKVAGHMQEHTYTFNGSYSLSDCPTNLSEQQICDKNCAGTSCSYACIKSRNVTEDCGTALDMYECFCPKYGSCCGLCEDGSGQPGCGACGNMNCCTASTCGRTVGCAASSQGACGEFTQHRKYEPTIGTANMLTCQVVITNN